MFFDTPEAIWKASEAALIASKINSKAVTSILTHRASMDIEAQWAKLEAHEISILTQEDTNYPRLLKEIPNPPTILYVRGTYQFNSKPILTIVGSRHSTAYGNRVAQAFAKDLVSSGIAVASGLAFGIDNAAHTGTLQAKGATIAVLGNSLDDDSIAPKSHLYLAHTVIRQGGALISEYPPVTAATPYTFPARNRILAGISHGVIVVESAERSGSLITARYALEYNREVFAVPGSIFSEASQGPHNLIRSGAKIVTSITDVLEEIAPLYQISPSTTHAPELSPHEVTLLAVFSSEPTHIDKILKTTTLETSQVHTSIVLLEVKGLIKNIGGMHYIKL